MFEVNKLFTIWLFAFLIITTEAKGNLEMAYRLGMYVCNYVVLQARNRSVGIMGE